jgi:hypothetical protein
MPSPVIDGATRPRALELFRQQKGGRLYQRAYAQGTNLSNWLEEEDPAEDYNDGLDAFSRQLMVAGIRTRSLPSRGIYADKFSAFDPDEGNNDERDCKLALVPEWISRQWRKVKHASLRAPEARAGIALPTSMPGEGQRASGPVITSDLVALGTVMRPYYDDAIARYAQIAPAVPLEEVVALTTPIDGDAYRAFYFTDDFTQERLVRVSEAAELPRAKLTGGDHLIRAYKYGRALEVSYEELRRQRIDVVAFIIMRMAVRSEVDKLAAVMAVMINGDGNANGATNFNQNALDTSAGAGVLTLKSWLAFKMKFLNPYQITTALTQDTTALAMQLLNTGTANVPLVTIQAASGFGGFRPINPLLSENVALGITADAPSSVVIGLDARFAIQRIVENGADIREVDRFVTRQTQVLTMSETEGYAVLDQNAVKTLTIV